MKSDLIPEEASHRQTQLRRLQTEMFSLQSDQSRLTRKHTDLVAEIRRLQAELSHLKENIAEKSVLERSLIREIELGEAAVTRVKKQMDTL